MFLTLKMLKNVKNIEVTDLEYIEVTDLELCLIDFLIFFQLNSFFN
jgi:hypothetical protein